MERKSKSALREKMYAFIMEYSTTMGLPPTIREIGAAMGISSTSHIQYHVKGLEKEGRIIHQPGKNRSIQLTKPTVGIPIIGSIAAGIPLDIFPSPAEFLPVDQNLPVANAFALLVRGRSMIEDHICDGDYVVVNPQPQCQNGEIIIATHLQEGVSGSATLKRFFKECEYVRLQPANAEMEPILIPKEEWDREWQIQGTVLAILRTYATSKKR